MDKGSIPHVELLVQISSVHKGGNRTLVSIDQQVSLVISSPILILYGDFNSLSSVMIWPKVRGHIDPSAHCYRQVNFFAKLKIWQKNWKFQKLEIWKRN